MIPESPFKIKNLFLIFPPGTGGNHLANMISMNPLFAPRFTEFQTIKDRLLLDKRKFNSTSYQEQMIELYYNNFSKNTEPKEEYTVAHFSDLENLQETYIQQYKDKIIESNGIYLFCSHAGEYCNKNRVGLLSDFTNRKFCIFSRPTEDNPIIYKRMLNGKWALGETSQVSLEDVLITDLYNPKYLFRLSQYSIHRQNSFILDTDKFFTVEGFDYVQSVFEQNLNIQLPESCRELHRLYVEYVSSKIF
jgi:hypothetical protein